MGKNKKKFVDKDSSSKFVLLHRSQQDAEYGNEGASEYVLYPMDGGSKARNQSDSKKLPLDSSKDHVNSLGFANDGYNYEQHLLSISEGGHFLSKTGVVMKAPELPPEALASTKEEKERQLEAVTISEACMDADMREALFNTSAFEYGDLYDDFVDHAAAEVVVEEASEETDKGTSTFDYEAHIARMLAASEKSIAGTGVWDFGGEKDDASGEEYGSEEEYDLEQNFENMNVNQQIVELEFEKALEEYDSDECGSLEDPDYDESMQGQLAIDNEDVSKLMDEFLEVHERDRTFHSKTKSDTVKDMNDQISKILSKNRADGAVGPEVEVGDDEYDDGEDSGDEDYMPEYLKPRETSEYDCESIVSTYSNIENHPSRIQDKSLKKKKKKSSSSSLSGDDDDDESTRYKMRNGAKVITISAKTGMPVIQEKPRKGGNNEGNEEQEAVNKGEARSKNESKEEKRLRKQQIKEERRNNRTVKSKLKSAYKEDDMLQQKTNQNSGTGVPIFKY